MRFSLPAFAAFVSIGATFVSAAVPRDSLFIEFTCTGNFKAIQVGNPKSPECRCVPSSEAAHYKHTDCDACTGAFTDYTPICKVEKIENNVVVPLRAQCGCQCAEDAYAMKHSSYSSCNPLAGCTGSAGTLSVADSEGFQTCTCNEGYSYVYSNGGYRCLLDGSANARRRKRHAQLAVESQMVADVGTNAFFCPNSETACAIGSGYECIDTTSALDSCGGCLTDGGVNCLDLPGSLGVACIDSKCVVSSCFPGWVMQDGVCMKN